MKLKNKKGNVFTVVIISISLLTIFIGIIFRQLNNQIIFNSKTLQNTASKYAAESGVEDMAARIIYQIETQMNSSSKSTLKAINFTKTNDKFADAKNKLIKAYEQLVEVNDKNNIFKDSVNKLYSITVNEYTSLNIMEEDINDIKLDIIQTLAVQDSSVKNEIKSTVYSIIDCISESQVILYSSVDAHTGETHGEINPVIETLGGGEIRVLYSQAQQDFIDDGSYSYRINSIYKYVINDLKGSVNELQSTFDGWVGPVSSLNNLQHVFINSNLGGFINTQITHGNPGGFNEFLWYQAYPNGYYQKFEEIKKAICNKIDVTINEYLTQGVENELYRIYIDEFRSEDRTNEKLNLIKKILEKIEFTKKNLIELKCKLGYVASNSKGEVTLPKPPEIDSEVITDLYIENSAIEENINNKNYKYKVEEIPKTYFTINLNENPICKIPISIKSTGNVNGKEYKIKSEVVFTIDQNYITNYYIDSYEKIK